MSVEAVLKQQHLNLSVDLEEQRIFGLSNIWTTISPKEGSGHQPWSNDSLSKGLLLPLQIPSLRVGKLLDISIDGIPTKWEIIEAEQIDQLLSKDYCDVLSWELVYQVVTSELRETLAVVSVPECVQEKVYSTLSSPSSKKKWQSQSRSDSNERHEASLHLKIQFVLDKLLPETSNLFFTNQWIQQENGKYQAYQLLLTHEQQRDRRAWFPTIPISAYLSSRCHWRVQVEVPTGYTAVSSGMLTKRYPSSTKPYEAATAWETFIFETEGVYGVLYPHQVALFVGEFGCCSGNKGVEFPVVVANRKANYGSRAQQAYRSTGEKASNDVNMHYDEVEEVEGSKNYVEFSDDEDGKSQTSHLSGMAQSNVGGAGSYVSANSTSFVKGSSSLLTKNSSLTSKLAEGSKDSQQSHSRYEKRASSSAAIGGSRKASTHSSRGGAGGDSEGFFVPTVTYITLEGLESLLETTNVMISSCLQTYAQILGKGFPCKSLTILYVPLQPLNMMKICGSSGSIDACMPSQSFYDLRTGRGLVACQSAVDTAITDSLGSWMLPNFATFGTLIVLPLEILHSKKELGFNETSFIARIVLAEALASIWLGSIIQPASDQLTKELYMILGFRKYLVDQFVEANFGTIELLIRRWERIQRYSTLIELGYDCPPLSQKKESNTSFSSLIFSEVFHLKCSIVFYAIERLFNAQSFLPDNFFNIVVNAYVSYCCKKLRKGQTFHESGFWKKILNEVTRLYIYDWNGKPQNRTGERQIYMEGKKLDLQKLLNEHEVFKSFYNDWEDFVTAYIQGSGMCQMNIGFFTQLQRKGTSMDCLAFHVDQQSLQPPIDVTSEGVATLFPADWCGIASFNLMISYLLAAQSLNGVDIEEKPSIDDCWKEVIEVMNGHGKALRREEGEMLGDYEHVFSSPLHFRSGVFSKNLLVYQLFYDPIDLIGRDGNFVLGFGYVGTLPHDLCIGCGQLWNCLMDKQESSQLSLSVFSERCVDSKDTSGTPSNDFQIPLASTGGLPYWILLLKQRCNLLIELGESLTVFLEPAENLQKKKRQVFSGSEKYWPGLLRIQIVEDDGVRDDVKRLRDGITPVQFQVDPRPERGRKKVATRGERPIGSEGAENAPQNDGGYAMVTQGFSGSKKIQFVGELSMSDKNLIETFKKVTVGAHPEYLQLDNRSLVAKVCSKTKLPMLWIKVDPDLTWISRFRRCQSGSMWEQQLLNDSSPCSQLEAIFALSHVLQNHLIRSGDSAIPGIIEQLSKALEQHRWHPFIRGYAAYALAFIHNRNPAVSTSIREIFQNYIIKFHSKQDFELKFFAQPLPSEMRFLQYFYRAVSLFKDHNGMTPSEAMQLLIHPLTCIVPETKDADFLEFFALLIECFANVSLQHKPLTSSVELRNRYYAFLRNSKVEGSSSPQHRGSQTEGNSMDIREEATKMDEASKIFGGGSLITQSHDGAPYTSPLNLGGRLADEQRSGEFEASVKLELQANKQASYLEVAKCEEEKSKQRELVGGVSRQLLVGDDSGGLRSSDLARNGEDSDLDESAQSSPSMHNSPKCATGLSHTEEDTLDEMDRWIKSDAYSDIEVIWLNIWRFFRLDSIKGMSSRRKVITCAFLRLLTRQAAIRDMARFKFLKDPDFHFPLDLLLFLPLKGHQSLSEDAINFLEMHFSYFDHNVHTEAIRSLQFLCCTGCLQVYKVAIRTYLTHKEKEERFTFNARKNYSEDALHNDRDRRGLVSPDGMINGACTLKSSFVGNDLSVFKVKTGLGVLSAVEFTIEAEKQLEDSHWNFKIAVWENLLDVFKELRHKSPVVFLPFSHCLDDIAVLCATLTNNSAGSCGPNPLSSKSELSETSMIHLKDDLSSVHRRNPNNQEEEQESAYRFETTRGIKNTSPKPAPSHPKFSVEMLYSEGYLWYLHLSDDANIVNNPPHYYTLGDITTFGCGVPAAPPCVQQNSRSCSYEISIAAAVCRRVRALLWHVLNTKIFRHTLAHERRTYLVKCVYEFLFGKGRMFIPNIPRPSSEVLAAYGAPNSTDSPPMRRIQRFAIDGGRRDWCPGGRASLKEVFGGFGLSGGDQLSDATYGLLVDKHESMLNSGIKLKRMCTFKRKYIDCEPPDDWLEVALEAVRALKEMPEAADLIRDPESIYQDYERVVRDPMWLNKIEAKAKNKMYRIAMDFKSDVAKIFRNAREVAVDNIALRKISTVEQQFENMWHSISRTFQAAEKKKKKFRENVSNLAVVNAA